MFEAGKESNCIKRAMLFKSGVCVKMRFER